MEDSEMSKLGKEASKSSTYVVYIPKKEKKPLCHPEKKFYCKNLCRSCYEKQLIENNKEYKKRQLENSKNWSQNNKQRKKESGIEYRKKRGPRSKERFASLIKKKYNLDYEDYLLMFKNQDNKCKLCFRKAKEGKKLHLDHCHTTGKIRGLLCAQCNWYLGFIEKDPDLLNRIKVYLNYE
jgi:hypothetical protein